MAHAAKVPIRLQDHLFNVPEPILSNRFDCPYSTATRCQQWQGWSFHKGVQHMDGHRALIYSRIRENRLNPGDSDISRGVRQQQVMQQTLSKLASVGTFFRLPFSGGDLMKPLSTDLSTNDFIQLAWIKFRTGTTLHCRLGGRDDVNWRKHTLSWVNEAGEVTLDYRPVHTELIAEGIDPHKIEPKARVY